MKILSISLAALVAISSCAKDSVVEQASSHGAVHDEVPTREVRDEVLIFTKTSGYRHESIAAGAACLVELASELGFQATHTEDGADFTRANLARFAAVVFLSTSGEVLDPKQQLAFEDYIQTGGAFMGIHAAADTEYEWPWYTSLVGAQFESHPAIQSAVVMRAPIDFPATDFLPERWLRTDEWYNFKALSPKTTQLLLLDENTYEGGKHFAQGQLHPTAWFQEYDGGRAFYTGGGHTDESYAEPLFRRHLKAGLAWVVERSFD